MSNAVVTDWPSGSGNAGWPQESTGMLMPGRVQGWPAGTQRAANAAERLLSQAVAWWDVGQYRDGDRFLRNRGTGGELLDLRLGSSIAPNSNDPKFLAVENRGYVYLPGVTSNFLLVPDEAALDITGDIDIRVLAVPDSYTPSAVNSLLRKTGASVNVDASYGFALDTTGTLRFLLSTDGITNTGFNSTASVPDNNGPLWLRTTRDATAGEIKFFTSQDGATWTQLGTTVTGVTTSAMFSGAGAVRIGAGSGAGSQSFGGKIYQAIVYSDLTETNKVLDIDCDAITSGAATSFAALTGQTVTINRSATGRKCVAVPRRGQPVFLLGTDDYMEVQDVWQHGLLGFQQGQPLTALVVARQHGFTASGTLMAKMFAGGAAANVGWIVRNGAGTPATGFMELADGTNLEQNVTASRAPGALNVLVAVRDSDNAFIYSNGQTTVSSPDGTKGLTLYNSLPVRIGNVSGSGAAYADMEFYTAAIFRRALTAVEIKTISDYMTARIA